MSKTGTDHLKISSLLKRIKEEFGIDILFECFAGLSIKNKLSTAEDIHAIPAANFRRNYDSDVVDVQIEDQHPAYKGKEILQIETSRSTILDALPEPFYIQPYDNTPLHVKDDRKKKAAYRAKQEKVLKSAQRFFKPLEIEYNRIRITRELQELELLERNDSLLDSFWQDIPKQNPEWRRFLRSLHLVSYIVGDLDKTKALIQYVLGKEIELELKVKETIDLPSEFKVSMDNIALGHNFSVGNSIYCYIQVCVVRIKDLDKSEFYSYYDNKSDEGKLLSEIEKYYFPLDVEIEFDFRMDQSNTQFSMGEHNAILGFATKL